MRLQIASDLHLEWLQQALLEPFDGKTVVVTHHGPHRQSIHPRYDGNLANAAFISDLTPLLDWVDLWIHGHVHDSFDYSVGRCRVLTPSRGYALNRRQARVPAERQWENSPFDARCVVAV